MIWPFVSRAAYDSLLSESALLRSHLTSAQSDSHHVFGLYNTLLDKYHQLKLLGAAVPEPAPAPAQRPAPDPVTQAIILKAGSSRALRKHYADYVTEQRTAGVDDAEIAQAIIQGVTDDEGVPS